MKPTQSVALPDRPPATIVPRSQNSAYHELPILQRYRLDRTTGCWEWLGYKVNNGYGRCKIGNRAVQAHRVFYEHHIGAIPDGLDLHHHCSNRGCVNPEHLEPVTRARNTQLGAHTKLTREQADEIRVQMDAMVEKYGVKPRTLAAIAERQTWKPEDGS